jgi:hypothetical protein
MALFAFLRRLGLGEGRSRRASTAAAGMTGRALRPSPGAGDPATIERHMMRNARIRLKLEELDPVKDAARVRELRSELTLREAALGVRGKE